MKEKTKEIFTKLIFNTSLFVVIFYLVKIITPHYCIVHKSEGRLPGLSSYCDWEYLFNLNERIIFAMVLFVLSLFIISFVKKCYERKN